MVNWLNWLVAPERIGLTIASRSRSVSSTLVAQEGWDSAYQANRHDRVPSRLDGPRFQLKRRCVPIYCHRATQWHVRQSEMLEVPKWVAFALSGAEGLVASSNVKLRRDPKLCRR